MGTRRANGEGSKIVPRKGRPGYESRIRWVDETGTPRRRPIYGRTTDEVVAKLEAARREIKAGRMPTTRPRDTLADYSEAWIRVNLELRVVDGSLTRDDATARAGALRLHVLPYLGDVRLTLVTVRRVRELMLTLATTPRRPGGKPRSTALRRVALIGLRQVLDAAVEEGILATNPARDVQLPAPRRVRPVPVALEAADVAAVLASTREHRLAALFVVLAGTGCRRQDVIGMRWSDLDLDAPEPTWAIAKGKTPAATRTVGLSAVVAEALRAHKRAQLLERVAAITWANPDVVFATRVGTPYVPRNLGRVISEACAAAGVTATAHTFRHTAVTGLLAAGIPAADIAAQVGHESAAMTLSLYAHGTRGGSRALVAATDAALGLG